MFQFAINAPQQERYIFIQPEFYITYQPELELMNNTRSVMSNVSASDDWQKAIHFVDGV